MAAEKRLTKKNSRKTEELQKSTENTYTEEEKARIANYLERSKRKPIKLKMVKDDSGKLTLEFHTTDKMLGKVEFMEALGTPDIDLQQHLLTQAIQTFRGCASTSGLNDNRIAEFSNYAMALLNEIQPQDEIEGMLAVQMIAVHNIVMDTMKQAMLGDQTVPGRETFVNQATKMLRTFTAQMEALKRYRTGGQQKVTVEHVYVGEGGQAIVGTVTTGGRGNSGKQE